MINPISNWLQRKEAEHKVELAEIEARGRAVRAISEATNMVTERPDTGGWNRSGSLDQAHLPFERQSMIRQARQMWRFDPNARAALGNLLYYIIGEGVKITPQSDDPRLHRLFREFWNAPRNRMQLKQGEFVLRTMRDGESILQFFNRDEEGKPTWKTTVRFRDPDLLVDPGLEYGGTGRTASDGILLDPNDHERALKYFFRRRYDQLSGVPDVVDASQVLHAKIMCDSEQKRGESYVQPAMEMFGQYKEWLRYRIVLNKVRTAMVMVRKVTGSAADVEAIKGTLQESRTQRTGEVKKRIPPPGTIMNANGGVDYEFKSANIAASDAAEDGRSMKLGMAAGTNSPEYVFGDASNANYASTLIAESPFVKGIRYWQTFFEFQFKEIYRRVVQAAVDAGKLKPPAEDDIFAEQGKRDVSEAEAVPPKPGEPQPSNGKEPSGADEGEQEAPVHELSEFEKFWGCDVQWPEVVHRDLKDTAAAIIQMVQAGLISESTASSVLGYDYEEEVRKQQLIEEDAAANPFKNKGGGFGDEGDMDAEMQDLVKGLTPEEAQKVMQSTDPQQVVALIKQKKAAKAKGE